MKAYRNRMLTIATLALAAIGAYASPAAAQAVSQGKFTLPYEVKWEGTVLPAGEYTFTLTSASLEGRLTIRPQDATRADMIRAMATDERNQKGKSALTVERHGGTRFVRDFYLADLHRVLHFRVPKISKEEIARGPATTEQVLVATAR